jgi:hypothetical protein
MVVGLAARPTDLDTQHPKLDADLADRPLFRRGIPLTQALRAIGINMDKGYILFGVEVYAAGGREPTVDLDIPAGATTRGALRAVFHQLPQYEFAILSPHFVSVYPKAALADPNDPLNVRASQFQVAGERAGVILTWPERFIPELAKRSAPTASGGPTSKHIDLYVGPVAGGPVVNLTLRNVTVRQILDAVSEATQGSGPHDAPLGWEYSFDPRSSFAPGGIQSWRLLMTLPHNWLDQVRKSGTSAP